jgi:hypothetical protein
MSYPLNNLIPTQEFVIMGQEYMEGVLGNNTFTWNGGIYPCVASVVDYKRRLDNGGFVVDLLLTMTVRQFDLQGNQIFTSGIPQSQQKLTFGGTIFRISNVAQDYIGAGARLIIVAFSPNRGL